MGLIDYGIAVFGRILIMAILLGLGFVLARAGRLGRDTVREMPSSSSASSPLASSPTRCCG